MRASVANKNSTRVDRPIVPAHAFPSPKLSFPASSGTATVSCAAVASPRASSAASVLRSTLRSHAAPSDATPCPSMSAIRRRRWTGASAFVHAASSIGASSTATTNIVRRMPNMRIIDRRSYSAASSAARSKLRRRAQHDKNTVTGSLECPQPCGGRPSRVEVGEGARHRPRRTR